MKYPFSHSISWKDLIHRETGIALGLFAVALIPRLLWALHDHPVPFSDMEDYYLCAVNLLKGKYLAMSEDRLAYRAPLYPLFIAACLKSVPGYGLETLRIAQAVIGSLSVVLLFHLSRMILAPMKKDWESWGEWISLGLASAAALAMALTSSQIFFTPLLMTETLFIFELLAWCLLAFRITQHSGMAPLTGLSVLLGLLALTRPAALMLLPILVFMALRFIPRPAWRKGLWLPFFGWLVPILPWTIRNLIQLHAFVLITTNSGVNFYIGHNPDYEYYQTGKKEMIRQMLARESGVDEVAEDRYFFRLGMNYILDEPGALFRQSGMKLYYLYWVDVPPWPWEEYGDRQGPQYSPLPSLPMLQWNPAWLLLSLAGVMYAFIKKYPHGIILSVIVLHTGTCLVYFARTRFRLPIEPFLLLYAWLGVVSLAETAKPFYRSLIKPAPSKEPPSSFEEISLRH